MTIREAENIVEELEYKSVLTDDEEFMLIEAFNYLIEQTKNSLWMIKLGGYYYGHKDFDLALKYYELADSYGNEWAPEGLGYIWYYGRLRVIIECLLVILFSGAAVVPNIAQPLRSPFIAI